MGPLIYIADKNRTYRRVVQECLLSLGYSKVKTFDDPRDILLSGSKPDIIILDAQWDREELSGLDFFREFGHTTYTGSRFIFLSSNNRPNVMVSALRMGAYDYILKGKSGLDRLVRKIERLAYMYRAKHRQLWSLRIALISLTLVSVLFIWAILQYNQ